MIGKLKPVWLASKEGQINLSADDVAEENVPMV
jgi:hypothetical protein